MNGHAGSVEPSVAGHRPARPNLVAVSDAVARQESQNPWATFALVAVGTFMTMLDASIVNISLPSIARTFHRPVGGAIEWVIIAYLVSSPALEALKRDGGGAGRQATIPLLRSKQPPCS